jgi:NAD(P)H-hydrate epimerase
MVHPLKGEFIEKSHVDELLSLTERRSAILIGGGMTREDSTLEAITNFLEKLKIPAVIDDDAIYAVARNKTVLKENFIVLPHSYEFFVLSGKKVSTNLKDRASAVTDVAKKLKITICLKGHVDVISDGRRTLFNKTGTPFMTKAGFGNTLAGICAAILARGVDCFTSACASAYLNGKAGEIASKIFGEGLTPTDLIQFIPDAINL